MTAMLGCILMTSSCHKASVTNDPYPMSSAAQHHLQHGRQSLLVVLLFGLLLGFSQLLFATHSHADELAQHEDCVLCHQHGAGFDCVPPTALLPEFGLLSQHTPLPAGLVPFILPLAPRARAPPASC